MLHSPFSIITAILLFTSLSFGQNADTDYRTMLKNWKALKFRQVTESGESFLVKYPGFKYRSGALYIIGHSYYSLRNFPGAVKKLLELISSYPAYKNKVAAMFFVGLSYFNLGNGVESAKWFTACIKNGKSRKYTQWSKHWLKKINPPFRLDRNLVNQEYNGKYKGEPFIASTIEFISKFRSQAIKTVSKKLGFPPRKYSFLISLQDCPNDDKEIHAQAESIIHNNKKNNIIYLYTEFIKIKGYNLEKKLVHEITHAMQRETLGDPYFSLPKWVKEGLAVWTAEQGTGRIRILLEVFGLNQKKNPLDELINGLNSNKHGLQDYGEDFFAFSLIELEKGKKAIIVFNQELMKDGNWKKALKTATGWDYNTLNNKTAEHAKKYIAAEIGTSREEYLVLSKLYKKMKYQEVIDKGLKHVKSAPVNFAHYAIQFLVGNSFYSLGQYNKAMKIYIELRDKHQAETTYNDNAAFYACMCLLKMKKYSEARIAFKDFLRDYSYKRRYCSLARKELQGIPVETKKNG